ncbi:MAG TPA: transglycosylase SLT domain-containing protein, partial [Polyangiaceae bacterium]|nr:transglycosylase SLT domain-containing protein [Polyangiaceae bacterium]
EDAFLAARALSRADRDREAEVAMRRVRERYPGSPFAEQARFHLGRIALLHGDHAAAVRAFDELALDKRGGKGRAEGRGEAARYRALAHFAARDYQGARRLFEALADDADTADLRARAKNLAALAALRDGDRTHAVARWSEVVRSRPLSFAALVAQARLAEAKAPPVPWLEPASGPPSPLASFPVTLPAPADLLHAVGLDDDAEDELRTREAFIESANPGRGVQALCAAYTLTGRARRLHQLALRVPSSLLGESPEGRARWAWECVFPRPFAAEVAEAEQANGLGAGFVHAIMRQESGFDPDVVSPARAVGLLQLLPETARAVAERAKMPHEDAWLTRPGPNIALGARYLHELGEKLDGDPLRVAGAYNAGPEAMTRWQERAKGVDLEAFVESIPYLETRGYVVRVMDNFARYSFASAGEASLPKVRLTL